jgi:ABC-type bacteriocin/lantibiotic exporter with double-glycine peptidase domain
MTSMLGAARMSSSSRRWFAPEVIQTSAMDCGPAALKCLLEGFRIPVSYARLRDACQTQIDGTSIDTLEEVACELGLDAEQVLIPIDHLLRPELLALPALAVVVAPSGVTHFVVLWNRVGNLIQVMDPATGRRFLTPAQLFAQLHVATLEVAADAWRSYAGRAEFLRPLAARLRKLVRASAAARLLEAASADATFRSLAALDAATRALATLAESGALDSASERCRVLEHWFARCRDAASSERPIPNGYWYAAPSSIPDGEQPAVTLRGAVIVRVSGRPAAVSGERSGAPVIRPALAPELAVALQERSVPALGRLWQLLRQQGRLPLLLFALVAGLLTSAALLETVLLRAQLELGRYLSDPWQRFAAALGALGFMSLLTLVELLLTYGAVRLGRQIEVRLRIAFMRKLPLLHDRYFQSRPTSDMADRSHMVHLIRNLPMFLLSLLRAMFELFATAAGLVWLDPSSLQRVAAACLLSLVLPILMLGTLTERDARMRSHVANLSRWYFDALRGLVAVRAHHAQNSLRAEHEAQLTEWKQAAHALARAGVCLECAVAIVSIALTSWLFLGYVQHNAEPVAALLFLYWSVSFPAHGREIASLARQLPGYANVVARLLEPIGASEAVAPEDLPPVAADTSPGTARPGTLVPIASDDVPLRAATPIPFDRRPSAPTPLPFDEAPASASTALTFDDVQVKAGGHVLLSGVTLRMGAAEHVAVVGASGAGKSSLLGVLLGWHRPTHGRVLWAGSELSEVRLGLLRRKTVWVDPSVQLWNRSLYDNLEYGSEGAQLDLRPALQGAELYELLEALPAGLQTELGEGGCCVSGGEGQKVRLGRGMLRAQAELVLLDEPFRGLDRQQRARLLGQARRHWSHATLLCVTHDIAETLEFSRVLVVADGRIVEDGAPRQLAADRNSRYAAMLAAERALLDRLYAAGQWRRIRLEHGVLRELSVTELPIAQPAHATLEPFVQAELAEVAE